MKNSADRGDLQNSFLHILRKPNSIIVFLKREDKGDREGILHTHPIP